MDAGLASTDADEDTADVGTRSSFGCCAEAAVARRVARSVESGGDQICFNNKRPGISEKIKEYLATRILLLKCAFNAYQAN
jgi:hypothetical protein